MYEDIFELVTIAARKKNLKESTARAYAPHSPSKDFSTEYCNAVHNHFLSQQYLEVLDYGSQPEKQALIGDLLSKSQTKKRMEEKQHAR